MFETSTDETFREGDDDLSLLMIAALVKGHIHDKKIGPYSGKCK